MLGLLLYPLAALLGLLLSAWAWERASFGSHAPTTRQRFAIFLGCIAGAALGAKLGFVIAEGFAVLRDETSHWSQRLAREWPVL